MISKATANSTFLDGKLRHGKGKCFCLLPHGLLAPEPELDTPGLLTPTPRLIYCTELLVKGPWGTGPRELNLQGSAVTLASSISILDLARRSLRSKSRCFCSRSASRSVTCFCRSASFWRSSVIWAHRQRERVREGERPRLKAAEKEAN